MTDKTKAKAVITLENLRLVESEIFRLTSRYGIKTIDELDKLLEKGKVSEKGIGEDLFRLDHLLEQRKTLEKNLKKLSINKSLAWKSLQDLLELPKQSFQTS